MRILSAFQGCALQQIYMARRAETLFSAPKNLIDFLHILIFMTHRRHDTLSDQ